MATAEVVEGDFMEQCRYAYMKIKKLLDLQGATMDDVVRIMTYTTDVRFFQDALKCRGGSLRKRSDSCFDIPGGQPVGVA
ncbi:MAG TPA: RidA family protein [Casimicrobiaceae bacterium]|nr:RidA family protein [Casimicrobiaceae bacterium]